MRDPLPDIGRTIRLRRHALGLTQAELARRAGLHVISLTRIETGTRHPSLKMLARLAHALGCEPAALLMR